MYSYFSFKRMSMMPSSVNHTQYFRRYTGKRRSRHALHAITKGRSDENDAKTLNVFIWKNDNISVARPRRGELYVRQRCVLCSPKEREREREGKEK